MKDFPISPYFCRMWSYRQLWWKRSLHPLTLRMGPTRRLLPVGIKRPLAGVGLPFWHALAWTRKHTDVESKIPSPICEPGSFDLLHRSTPHYPRHNRQKPVSIFRYGQFVCCDERQDEKWLRGHVQHTLHTSNRWSWCRTYPVDRSILGPLLFHIENLEAIVTLLSTNSWN